MAKKHGGGGLSAMLRQQPRTLQRESVQARQSNAASGLGGGDYQTRREGNR